MTIKAELEAQILRYRGAAPDWTWRLRPALRLLFFFGKRLSTMRTACPDAGHVSSRPTGSLHRALHQQYGHHALVISASSFLLSRHSRHYVTPPDLRGFRPPSTLRGVPDAHRHQNVSDARHVFSLLRYRRKQPSDVKHHDRIDHPIVVVFIPDDGEVEKRAPLDPVQQFVMPDRRAQHGVVGATAEVANRVRLVMHGLEEVAII